MNERLGLDRYFAVDKEIDSVHAQNQLEHVTRLATLGTIASGIAHELGTPLNVVLARAKMIARREVQGDEVLDNAEVIVEQAERMTRIIGELLDFASVRTPRRVRMDLVHAIEQAVLLLQPIAQDEGVTIERGPMERVEIEADPLQLQQALTNLMLNGVQAMPEGGVLRVALQVEEHALAVEIEDEGTGIEPEDCERIFKAFFTTKEPGKGTGLGLPVSERIIKDHGGEIRVVSEVGRGSRFTIILPR